MLDEIKRIFPFSSKYFILVCHLALLLVFDGSLFAQEKDVPYYQLDPILVTASRIPDHLSKIAQSVAVITREEIKLLPAKSIPDLLEYVSGVDVHQRGLHGVQADIGIRGGSFEQTLVLVDGINMSDPQTGHHNMDLPVNIEDIERIEVIKGPGARIYGHNAMAGVIHIITREAENTFVGGEVKYGRYGYYGFNTHGALKTGSMSNRVSASRYASEGHIREKTDVDIKTLSYTGAINRERHRFKVGMGYTDKDFGAYGFYSDVFPNERERTDTLLVYTSAHLQFADMEVVPNVFWRRHNDDFKIKTDSWDRNKHRSDTSGAEIHSRFKSRFGSTAFGGEVVFETLESSNLDDHNRHREGVFLEHKYYPLERLALGFGSSAMRYSDWDWEYWPGADLNLELTEGFNWFVSCGRSFRIPTFTELYYNTRANKGNPDLKPEKAWTYETGVRLREKYFCANFALFLRDSKNLIDWSRTSKAEPWKARNISEITTQGIELGLDLYRDILWDKKFVRIINITYTYLDSEWDTGGLDSKYVLDRLRHQVHSSIILAWSDKLNQILKARYEKRMIGESQVIVDTRLGYKCKEYEFFLEATNLLDKKFFEPGCFSPMPGLWIIGGIKFHIDLLSFQR